MYKKLYALTFVFLIQMLAFSQKQNITYTFSPTTFGENQSVTLTVDASTINQAVWATTNLYIWSWSFDTATNTQVDCPTNGSSFGNSTATNKMTYNAGANNYTYTFTPTAFFGRNGINKMGFLIKNQTGTVQTIDYFQAIGAFQFTNLNPKSGTTTFVAPGGSYPINYKTSIAANWVLKANGTVINTANNTSSYFYPYSVTTDVNMELTATNPADNSVLSSKFAFGNTPVVQSAAIPAYIKQGINYDPADPTKVGLALYAPLKTYVHVLGSFNNWSVNSNYLMKKDTANPDLYWIEIIGLTAQQIYTFQYRTNDGVKVADPYSSLILSPDDDKFISATTYPNMPAYPAGQQFDVSIIQTAKPAYNWTTTNFTKPAKQNLIVYEALVRDFTANKNWQAMIDKLPYIKGLNVNAIELMPIMEFDGNNSWGYNPAFHYALDKAYGTPEKFKEFVDKCHQNGIAVILDIALNHATGQSPLERMWSVDDGSGYGPVAANNPYFNQTAKHSYSVFYDFDHSKPETKYYVNRVLAQWINEYKVDGFRWDLTKGFTQKCTDADQACTNAYQQDRVDILKGYADYQWASDPNSYIIFEHLGTDAEEQEWANYRINEGKGIMMWDNITGAYDQNSMGYTSDSNIGRADFENHGFTERRNMTYGESHDEERIVYKDINFGATNGTYNVKDLATALQRQKAYGAIFLPIPGPKMIWQFGELGYDFGINRCVDGSINNNCRLDEKPVAFTLGYDQDANRKAVYDTWAKILQIRLANQVFDTKTFTVESGNLMPIIFINNDALDASTLKNVVILANLTLTVQNIIPNLPYAGTWYNLMDSSVRNFGTTTDAVTLQPGDFIILGNKPSAALATDETKTSINSVKLQLEQNPVANGEARLKLNNAKNGTIAIYDLSGKLITSAKTETDNGTQVLKLNNIKSGMYLIQLRTEKGNAVTKMIVK
ncbi:alpha-amylase family glycosyl hydrolase [Halpernia frigidisoli]|uniref:Por secretion system C-terminal sorting domain-containing protein n=1 Tax=Halpernia frigidisoli TaxID=1125876 RepID=A0A1I3G171_9FLAO|nr:alpha-amylase family glycosyl hydrolase [Halpernia frigidisoli]SFI16911.1 Por secretion system C-terminal sorting domain-containing protein [Halpernia frigidisoli]